MIDTIYKFKYLIDNHDNKTDNCLKLIFLYCDITGNICSIYNVLKRIPIEYLIEETFIKNIVDFLEGSSLQMKTQLFKLWIYYAYGTNDRIKYLPTEINGQINTKITPKDILGSNVNNKNDLVSDIFISKSSIEQDLSFQKSKIKEFDKCKHLQYVTVNECTSCVLVLTYKQPVSLFVKDIIPINCRIIGMVKNKMQRILDHTFYKSSISAITFLNSYDGLAIFIATYKKDKICEIRISGYKSIFDFKENWSNDEQQQLINDLLSSYEILACKKTKITAELIPNLKLEKAYFLDCLTQNPYVLLSESLKLTEFKKRVTFKIEIDLSLIKGTTKYYFHTKNKFISNLQKDYITSILNSVFLEYDTNLENLRKLYVAKIPGYIIESRQTYQKKTGLRSSQLKELEPNIFGKKYTQQCQKRFQPYIVESEEEFKHIVSRSLEAVRHIVAMRTEALNIKGPDSNPYKGLLTDEQINSLIQHVIEYEDVEEVSSMMTDLLQSKKAEDFQTAKSVWLDFKRNKDTEEWERILDKRLKSNIDLTFDDLIESERIRRNTMITFDDFIFRFPNAEFLENHPGFKYNKERFYVSIPRDLEDPFVAFYPGVQDKNMVPCCFKKERRDRIERLQDFTHELQAEKLLPPKRQGELQNYLKCVVGDNTIKRYGLSSPYILDLLNMTERSLSEKLNTSFKVQYEQIKHLLTDELKSYIENIIIKGEEIEKLQNTQLLTEYEASKCREYNQDFTSLGLIEYIIKKNIIIFERYLKYDTVLISLNNTISLKYDIFVLAIKNIIGTELKSVTYELIKRSNNQSNNLIFRKDSKMYEFLKFADEFFKAEMHILNRYI